jgi:hypothetical protein
MAINHTNKGVCCVQCRLFTNGETNTLVVPRFPTNLSFKSAQKAENTSIQASSVLIPGERVRTRTLHASTSAPALDTDVLDTDVRLD